MSNAARFSLKSISFLKTAGRQKSKNWLEKHQAEYDKLVLAPLRNLARHLKAEIGGLAPDYNFPQKGIGRLKRTASSVARSGGGPYRDWLTYSAARPRVSRFEHNPNLFFMINTEDEQDPILVAGGLYMPSSRQTRALRESLANDGSAFEQLFASKSFSRRFPGGFSDEKISSRLTRGYDPAHPRMNWLRLQAFFVWRPYSRREFYSADFPRIVADDWRQILRLNRLLELALNGTRIERPSEVSGSKLLDRLDEISAVRRPPDFQ